MPRYTQDFNGSSSIPPGWDITNGPMAVITGPGGSTSGGNVFTLSSSADLTGGALYNGMSLANGTISANVLFPDYFSIGSGSGSVYLVARSSSDMFSQSVNAVLTMNSSGPPSNSALLMMTNCSGVDENYGTIYGLQYNTWYEFAMTLSGADFHITLRNIADNTYYNYAAETWNPGYAEATSTGVGGLVTPGPADWTGMSGVYINVDTSTSALPLVDDILITTPDPDIVLPPLLTINTTVPSPSLNTSGAISPPLLTITSTIDTPSMGVTRIVSPSLRTVSVIVHAPSLTSKITPPLLTITGTIPAPTVAGPHYSRIITIPATTVAEDLYDFPLSLRVPISDPSHYSGYPIVKDAGGNRLPLHVVSWDGATLDIIAKATITSASPTVLTLDY
jgi:hypothetical protein